MFSLLLSRVFIPLILLDLVLSIEETFLRI